MNQRQAQPPASPLRGTLLVAAAVVLGLVLLRNGIDTDVSTGADRASSEGRERSETSEATTTTVAARPPAEVLVVVANGAGVDGAATRVTTTLQGLGYQTGTPADAERVEATAVYFVEGFEVEAQQVAVALRGTAEMAVAMPDPPPVADTQSANVVVVLGPDLAPQ